MESPQPLKAPFPYFGGKRQVTARVWAHLNPVNVDPIDNYVEPFAGSLAVLLARETPINGPETVNDRSCLLINAWRAIQQDPEGLAPLLISPCAEVDTEAQHWQLVTRADALRNALGDPDHYDVKLAAYWIKGANEWIGSGWAAEGATGPWSWSLDKGWQKRNRKLPHLGSAGTGINRQLPHLGNAGTGINRQLPHLGNAGRGQYEERVAWVLDWLNCLRDRLCRVRIACGDFERVLTPSVTTKHGVTGVFLDPPYDGTEYVYGADKAPISRRVREWCLKADPKVFRIVLAGRGEEHDELVSFGWAKEVWTAGRGYSGAGNTGRAEEALWVNGGSALTPRP